MNRTEARETLVYAIGEFVDNCIDAGDAEKYWEAMTYYDSLPDVAPSNGDLISRADAIGTVRNSEVLLAYDSEWSADVLAESAIEQTRDCLVHALKALPSAEYSKPLQTTLNGDLISRADAIEAVKQAIYNHDSAIMRITSLPSASVEVGEWIPCSKRLPKEKARVLTYDTMGDIVFGQYDKGRWYWEAEACADYWAKNDGVIAWMPLPMPYEGSESDETD